MGFNSVFKGLRHTANSGRCANSRKRDMSRNLTNMSKTEQLGQLNRQ